MAEAQSAVRVGVLGDGRHVVTLGAGILLVCSSEEMAQQAADVVRLGLNAGIGAALSLDGTQLASAVLLEVPRG